MHALLLALVAGCPSDTDSDPTLGTDTDTDLAVALGFECDGRAVELGNTTATGECVNTDTSGPYTLLGIRADCTDGDIQGHLDKRHVVMIPQAVTQDAVWVHLPGSGGQPSNTTNIGEAAIEAGYRYIGLAYLNEPSAAERCSCPEGSRPPDCDELTRLEVLYGAELTPWTDMTPEESIEHRLTALLQMLHERRPNDGWDDHLGEDGIVDWTTTAVSGFSQGGGMAGLIARDHAVARAMYLSKGADGDTLARTDPTSAMTCDSHDACDSGICCPIAGVAEDCGPVDGAYNVCADPAPGLTALGGADTDGDYLSNGDASTRATPGSRQFALIHREESAWSYSPTVFELWGMGTDYVDADAVRAPFAEGTQLFSTALEPRNNCSEHQSMGANSCQPRREGEPAMREAWLHAMTAPVD